METKNLKKIKLRSRLTWISLLLFIATPLFSQNAGMDTLIAANTHYEQAEYNEAIKAYSKLIELGYISDHLHYNLGNSYFKTKKIALAILHYEKALKLNPSNQDATFNLQLANQKTVDKVESVPDLFVYRWWNSIYNLMSANDWAKLTILLFFISVIGFLTFRFSSTVQFKKASFYLFVSTFLIGLLFWGLAFQQNTYLNSRKHAVIMNSTVNIISAPSEGSSQLFVLHEGTKVKLKEEGNGWLKIALPNGNEGWVKEEELEVI